ncbi:Rieske (2Fe-2S) protein [Cupriavidus necator]|uniref:Rieske (2Fe-2S) protein n=1 Tax=Cupriavidus necator TaxID=106590 RepID=UPI0005B30F8A|nr:Rieske 2Fe-2S domain-containing protein [Cupriavidus necator]
MHGALLCRLASIPDGGACVVDAGHADGTGVVVIRRGHDAWAYLNRCPHFSVCLDYEPGEVLTYDGQVLMCAHHSALFRFEDGRCIEGPCAGAALTPVAIRVVDGEVRCAAGMPAVP